MTKLRASDGMLIGTYAVGTYPIGIAFDGANVWVASYQSNTVTKLRVRDGALLGTTDIGLVPDFIAGICTEAHDQPQYDTIYRIDMANEIQVYGKQGCLV